MEESGNGIPFRIVNGYQNQVQKVIRKLETLEADKTEQELLNDLKREEDKIAPLEAQIVAKKNEVNELLKESNASRDKLAQGERKVVAIKQLVNDIQTDTIATKILDSIVNRNKKLVGVFDGDNLVKTKVNFGNGRI